MDLHRLGLFADSHAEKTQILDLFFKNAVEGLRSMREAKALDQEDAWKDAAHKMRGAASNLGMKKLEALCLNAEHVTWNSGPACVALLAGLEKEIEEIKAFVAGKITEP
jgi:HPt (histidine-containing phosphotransfer) domain-containing protein